MIEASARIMAFRKLGGIATLLAFLAIVALGVGTERALAYNVGTVSVPAESQNVVYGNWIQTQVQVSVGISAGSTNTVTWSASGLPDNTSYQFDQEETEGSDASARLLIDQTENTSGPDIGTYSITVTATGDNGSQSATFDLEVLPRPVKILGSFTVEDKPYDRSTAATLDTNNLTLQASDNLDAGKIARDDLTLNPVATFNQVNAGSRTASLAQSTLGGSDAANYDLQLEDIAGQSYVVPTASGTITPKILDLDPTSLTFQKAYDGLLTITPSGTPTVDASGVESGDSTPSVSGSVTWRLTDANAGSGKQVQVTSGSYTLSNSNYSLGTTTLNTATVNKATLTVNFSATDKEYDGTTDILDNVTITGYSGRAASDSDVTVTIGSASLASSAVGTHVITLGGLTISPSNAGDNYTVQAASGVQGTITKKTLSIGGLLDGDYDKDYDGTTAASGSVSNLTLTGIVESSEDVEIDTVALAFDQADAGSRTVTITGLTLRGTNAGNYRITLDGAPTGSATIRVFQLTTTITFAVKVYDGTDSASVTCTLNPFAGGLDVQADCSNATFDGDGSVVLSGGVPQAQAITVSGITLSGDDAANYSIASTSATGSAVINPKNLTITGITAERRAYDGTTTATVSGTPTLSGRLEPDLVSVDASSASFSFADADKGVNKAVTASGYALSGADRDNYTLTQPTGLTATIDALGVSVVVTANDKVYDSNTTATVTLQVTGEIAGDTVSASHTNAVFNGEHVATDRTVTVSGITLNNGNYTTDSTATGEADITARTLEFSDPRREYNGVTTGDISFSHTAITGDNISVKASGTFGSKAAGAQSLSFTDFQVTGTDAENYTWVTPSITTGTIDKKPVRIDGLTADDKLYDATTTATASGTAVLRAANVIGGDDLNLTGSPSYTFARKYVGEDIRVTTTGFSLSGENSLNYRLIQPFFDADITSRQLTISGSFTANDKVYDRLTTASGNTSNLTLVGVQTPDSVNLSSVSLRFASASANESTPTVVRVHSASVNDRDMNNDGINEYSITVTGAPTSTATISRYDLDGTLNIQIADKTYDRTDAATISSISVTSLGSDVVEVNEESTPAIVATFEDALAGVNKEVTITNLSLTGTHAANYSLTATAVLTDAADINQKALTVSGITAEGKTYDGTQNPSTVDDSAAQLVGIESGDTVTLDKSGAAWLFNNENQGTRTLDATGYAIAGTDVANYTLTQPRVTNLTIGQRTLTAGANTDASGNTRVYDGTDDAEDIVELTLSGFATGDEDDVELTASSITFDGPRGRDVGNSKPITASGLALATPAGGSATITGNYTLNGVSSVTTSASITPYALTLTPSPTSPPDGEPLRYEKTYDGSALAEFEDSGATIEMVTCSVNALSPGGVRDDVNADCTDSTFASANVSRVGTDGTGEVQDQDITVSNIALEGTDASNYSLATTSLTLTEASINPRQLVASGFEPLDKDYDGQVSANFSISDAALTGFVPGDATFAFDSLTGVFFSRDVAVSGGDVIDQNVRLTSWRFNGSAGVISNYTIDVQSSITQAKILPIELPVALTGAPKTYDGNTDVVLTATIDSDDLLSRDRPTGGDAFVDATATGSFSTKNAGASVPITISSVTLAGGDAGDRSDNYFPSYTAPSATISPRTLTWTATAQNKIYDGTRSADVTLTNNRVSGDTFATETFTSALFDTEDVGTGKTVTVSGISISGGDADNYTYTSNASDTANISARAVTVTGTFTAEPKQYDQTTSATVDDLSSLSLTGIADPDSGVVTIGSTTATFDSASVDTGKTVTLDSLTLTGANSSNYTVDVSGVSPYTSGVITPRVLEPTVTIQNKNWDGGTSATITGATVTGLSGEDVTVNRSAATAAFRTADSATNKEVDVTGLVLEGTDAANYVLISPVVARANITGVVLTATFTASHKEYDGTTSASVTPGALSLSDAAHDVNVRFASANFAAPEVDTGVTVTVSGIELFGEEAGQYSLSSTTATTSANITAKPLGISAEDKVYDSTDIATVTLDGVVSGDTVSLSFDYATFADENVGDDKVVTAVNAVLADADASNYTIATSPTTTADITPRTLVFDFQTATPVTEPTSPVTVTPSDDRVTGDDLTVTASNASAIRRGNELVLIVTGISVTGTDATNYVFSNPWEEVFRTFPPAPSSSESSAPALTPAQLLLQGLANTGVAGSAIGLGITSTLLFVLSGVGFIAAARLRSKS